jgi:hypothetical protein
MDVAAAGFAASQIASGQRSQQAGFAGIKGQQKQDQAVANLLAQAVSAAQPSSAAPTAPELPVAPSLDRGIGNGRPAGRGSLVDILA